MSNENEVDMQKKAPRRIGVLGAGGQVGRCLIQQIDAAPDLALAFGFTHADIDLSDTATLPGKILEALGVPESDLPEIVINAAAYTKVDLCESESELAYQTNALAPAEWSRRLAERNIRFIHISKTKSTNSTKSF